MLFRSSFSLDTVRLLQSFGIFVTGYLARPLGGILMAHFADHLGRSASRIKGAK